MDKIEPKDVRYIKLGKGGEYKDICFRENVLRLGYHQFPDFGGTPREEIPTKAKEFARAYKEYTDKGAATRHAEQVADFYWCGKDTLWFTFDEKYLYWCFAEMTVKYFGKEREKFKDGSRERKAVNGWHKTNINGKSLLHKKLDGRLTKTSAFRGTICNIDPEVCSYLTRIINDEDLPYMKKAKKCRADVLESIINLTRSLHWKDFELLTELIFSRSGWRRIGFTGGTQKTIDIPLELPSTGEKAFVQVKSETNKKQFNKYIEDLQELQETRMFYVYHTGPELTTDRKDVTVINAEKLAEMILNAGLFDWLIKKSGF